MMAHQMMCDPCLNENKSSAAIKYCSECEEQLCNECAESHLRFKAFKRHHLIDCELADSRLPPSSSTYCESHPDFQLDLFCRQHDSLCCCACVPLMHKNCLDVLPIKIASKNIRGSSLVSDSMNMVNNLMETIDKLSKNRETNRTLLNQTKTLIIGTIQNAKADLLQEINRMEVKMIADLNSIHQQNERIISNEEEKLYVLASNVKKRGEQLNFLKNHGSDKQLFIALRQTMKENQRSETEIQDLISQINEIRIEFKRTEALAMKPFGSIDKVTQPCNIQHKGVLTRVAQVHNIQHKMVDEFKLDNLTAPQSELQVASKIPATFTSKNFRPTCFLLDKKTAHKEITVSEDGTTFTNYMEAAIAKTSVHSQRNKKFKGACGTHAFTYPGIYYYEVLFDIKIIFPMQQNNIAFEIGIARKSSIDNKKYVEGQPFSWSMIGAHHPVCDAICVHVVRDRKIVLHKSLIGNKVNDRCRFTFGFLLDTEECIWEIYNREDGKKLCAVRGIDCKEPLFPVVSGYNSGQIEVNATFITGHTNLPDDMA